ncbi:MAG: IS110 family transposase [Gemmatimonadales bacterium]
MSDRHSSYYTITSDGGEEVEEGRIRTTRGALEAHFGGARRRIVLEVGPHSPWISRLLEELGHEVIVANARMVALIHSNPKKRDPVDAQTLARLGRVDPKLLYPIQHRSEQAQVDLGVVRARDVVVRARTGLINHVRGSVKSFGGRIPGCSAEGFAAKAEEHVPEALRAGLEPVLEMIRDLSRQIRFFDKQIDTLCEERYPETGVLRQIKGVGPVTALTFCLVIEDPARFPNSRAVGAYLGLTRRHHDSGESEPELRITKAGDAFVRRLLVQSAQYALGRFGPDTDLRRWGLRYVERSGGSKTAKKKATVAVARKLAVLLHRLWSTGEVYQPLRQDEHSAAAA